MEVEVEEGQHEELNCFHRGEWWRDWLVVTMMEMRLKCGVEECFDVIVIVGLAWK